MNPDEAIPHRCGVLGLGLHTDALPHALQALWQRAQAQLPESAYASACAPQPICAVAVLDTKAGHPALEAWMSAVVP